MGLTLRVRGGGRKKEVWETTGTGMNQSQWAEKWVTVPRLSRGWTPMVRRGELTSEVQRKIVMWCAPQRRRTWDDADMAWGVTDRDGMRRMWMRARGWELDGTVRRAVEMRAMWREGVLAIVMVWMEGQAHLLEIETAPMERAQRRTHTKRWISEREAARWLDDEDVTAYWAQLELSVVRLRRACEEWDKIVRTLNDMVRTLKTSAVAIEDAITPEIRWLGPMQPWMRQGDTAMEQARMRRAERAGARAQKWEEVACGMGVVLGEWEERLRRMELVMRASGSAHYMWTERVRVLREIMERSGPNTPCSGPDGRYVPLSECLIFAREQHSNHVAAAIAWHRAWEKMLNRVRRLSILYIMLRGPKATLHVGTMERQRERMLVMLRERRGMRGTCKGWRRGQHVFQSFLLRDRGDEGENPYWGVSLADYQFWD